MTDSPGTHQRKSPTARRSAIVFGASGFIGRWLVRELLDQSVTTTAVVRSTSSARQLLHWLEDHQAAAVPEVILAQLDRDDLGWPPGEGPAATEVYNMAGAYQFGMTVAQARAANVDTARRVVAFAATLPGVVRLVHLSGYRVGGQDPTTVPWTARRVTAEYRRLGAYEASKVESDAAVQAHAAALGVPLSIVNPSTVIGDSRTGETPQRLGLAGTVLDLLAGRLPALPGGRDTFVPVVTVDYLASFTALLPTDDATENHSYWVLDDTTPPLPDLLRLIGDDHGVKVPRARIPVALLRRLPRRLTRADPETLSFLSADRYPTGPAHDLARNHGLNHPDVAESLRLWSRYLAAERRPLPSTAVSATAGNRQLVDKD